MVLPKDKLNPNVKLGFPKNLWSSVRDCNTDTFVIASVLEGSFLIPSEEIICPKNTIESFQKWHLFFKAESYHLKRISDYGCA